MHSRTKETIAPLGNGLYISRTFGIVAKRLSQLAHRHAEAAVEINERIARPEAASKFLSSDDFSRAFKQCDKEPIGLLLQPNASPVLQQLPRSGVHLKRTELIDNSGLCLHTWPPESYRS
jgi:hypothetical protein